MSSLQQLETRVLQGTRDPEKLHGATTWKTTLEAQQETKTAFKKLMDISSGDPHRAGMAPLSFVRQVLAVCLYPELLEGCSFPLDVQQRARRLLGFCGGGSVGSYTTSSWGLPQVLKSISEFITWRDGGVKSNPEDLSFSSGSQKTLWMVFHLMAGEDGKTQTGILTPVPCPHTLPALMESYGVKLVPYQLMEDRGWAIELDELQRALKAARRHCKPRALYISNPGNPTGHVQDRKTIQEVIRFAAAEGLVLLAEEVYQDSVFGQDKEFISYKRVLFEMGKPYSETVELLSFHSISSACMGECGLRGGYMEMINLEPEVKEYLKNMQAPSSPPVLSQLALELMVNPPSPGDVSYQTYTEEILQIKTTLSQNARRACEFLNNLPGMTCQPAMAGIFLYPRLSLPSQMVEDAKMLRVKADVLYCQRFLEEEGVCLGAGSENGQEHPNLYIRLCVLAPPDTLEEILASLCSFHLRLLSRFP